MLRVCTASVIKTVDDLFEDDDLSFGKYDDISDVIKRQYITHSEAIGEALKNTADFAIVIMMKRWYNISK